MAEGAALEMPCRGNSTVGSNPTPSAIFSAVPEVAKRLPVQRQIRRSSEVGMRSQDGEKGSAARRRPKAAREAYSLYVKRAAEGANEADGPLSAPCKGGPC